MSLAIEPVIDAPGWSVDFDPEALAHTSIEAAARNRSGVADQGPEVCVIFTSDGKMRELNRDWRKIDKATNVLSFPAIQPPKGAPPMGLGDIFLGLETVQREAAEQGKSFHDHTAHLIVHGFLHLIGYDHETDSEAADMEGEETVILATLGIANPYDGEWRPENAG